MKSLNNIINDSYKKPEEYSNKRAMIDNFGEQSKSINQWLLGHYDFIDQEKLLELGCGTGEFWIDALHQLRANQSLLLTDFSIEMLEKTKKNLQNVPTIATVKYQKASIDNLKFSPKTFDVILAHLMIYHASDPASALNNIMQILSENGWLGITTQHCDSFKSHMEVAHEIDSSMPNTCINTPADTDKLGKILKHCFPHVKQYDYINPIHWPSGKIATQFARMLLSISVHQPSEAFYRDYENAIDAIIAKEGRFTTYCKVSLFIASKRKIT